MKAYFYPYPAWSDEGFQFADPQGAQPLSFSGGWAYHHVSKSVRGHHGWLKARSSMRWGMQVEGTWFDEDIDDETSELNIFEARLINTAYSENALIDMGFGAKFLAGEDHRAGIDFGVSMEWYPAAHVVVDASADFALVSGVWLRDFRVGVGVVRGHVGARLGYRSIWVNDEDLSGPEFGVFFTF